MYVNEKLSDVLLVVARLQEKVDYNTGTAAENSSASTDVVMTTTDIAVEVHKTLADVSRRKSNIVVTGIPESTIISDERAFFTHCGENFSFKPNLSHLGCRRLEKKFYGFTATTKAACTLGV